MIQVGREEAVHNPLEAFEHILAMGLIASEIHDHIEMRHPAKLAQYLDTGIGVDERRRLADDHHQNPVAGEHEVQHVVFDAGGRIHHEIIEFRR